MGAGDDEVGGGRGEVSSGGEVGGGGRLGRGSVAGVGRWSGGEVRVDLGPGPAQPPREIASGAAPAITVSGAAAETTTKAMSPVPSVPVRRAGAERAVTLLLDTGFPLPDVMPVLVALENVVLGSALDLAAPVARWEITDASATPRLAEALDAVGDGRADAAFELALAGFLAHARRRLETHVGV